MLLLMSAVGIGCVSGRSLVSQQTEASRVARGGSSISRDGAILPPEIRAASQSSVYDAVLRLRPGFFTGNRSIGSATASVRPSVVLEGGTPESLDVLRLISADAVAEIRFIEPREATLRYGPGYTAGVVFVRLAVTSQPFE
jgi:hypothetical protein